MLRIVVDVPVESEAEAMDVIFPVTAGISGRPIGATGELIRLKAGIPANHLQRVVGELLGINGLEIVDLDIVFEAA